LQPVCSLACGTFSAEDSRAIVIDKKYLTVYGYVLYGDVFGSTIHELHFCKMCGGVNDDAFLIDWPSSFTQDKQEPQNQA
jgi:hypothetical protein